MKKIILTLSLLTTLLAPSAQAVELSLVGGLNFSKSETDPAPAGETYSSKMGYDYGAMFSFGIVPMLLDLQLGAIMDSRKFGIKDASGETEISTKYLQIPVLLRFKLLMGLSLGAGGYYASASGDIDAKSGSVENTFTYDQVKLKKSDYGVIASVAYQKSLAPMISLLFDARYVLGLANLNDVAGSTATKKNTSIEVLTGVSFGF